MAAQKTLYKKSTNTVTLTLTDAAKVLLTGATVTCNLIDGSLANVLHATNFSLAEVNPTTQPGVYSATIPATFDPPVATNYTLQTTAVQSGRTLYGETSVGVAIQTIK
jgi:hypothetical protein